MLRTIYQQKTNAKSVQIIKEGTSKIHIYGKLLKILKAHTARKTALDTALDNAANNVQPVPRKMHARGENCAVVETTRKAQYRQK